MKLFCKIFNHKPPIFAHGNYGSEYGKLEEFAIDGIGRHHGRVIIECARCGEKFEIAKVHIPITKEVL